MNIRGKNEAKKELPFIVSRKLNDPFLLTLCRIGAKWSSRHYLPRLCDAIQVPYFELHQKEMNPMHYRDIQMSNDTIAHANPREPHLPC